MKATLHFVDINQIYHFFFETFYGVGCLVGLGLLISLIACIVLERKTRAIYKNHEKSEDEWSLFDDDDDDESSTTSNSSNAASSASGASSTE